jgi:uncharacterized RDD family membrane protein YckC
MFQPVRSKIERKMELTLLHLEAPEKAAFYAGFCDRTWALLIDLSLLFICFLPFDIAFGTSLVTGRTNRPHTHTDELLVALIFCLYSAFLDSSKRRATLGKRALGIAVIDQAGDRISFRRALLRSALLLIAFPIGCLLIPLTRNKQALHDLLADTLIVPGTYD